MKFLIRNLICVIAISLMAMVLFSCQEEEVEMTGVSVVPTTMTLYVGGSTDNITAIETPENATTAIVLWSSSDALVAIVDKGVVTPLSEGTTTITAKAGDVSATCVVIVKAKEVAVSNVSLSATTMEMTVGDENTLVATIAPENASNKNVNWTSSDEEVATVEAGLVKALKSGEATITATTVDGGKSATCTLTVKDAIVAVTGIKLDQASIELIKDDEKQLVVTVMPENATDKSVNWTSSDEEVATVEAGLVKALKSGESTITATTVDGGKVAKCTVIVVAKTIAVESVSLNKTTITLEEGECDSLVATVLPENATNKNVNWKSSNESVAKVVAGKVTAQQAGEATITVETADGHKTATYTVTVAPKDIKVESVAIEPTELTIIIDESSQLTAVITPENATNKNVNWKSSDESVAKVAAGKVTAIKVGSATITATTEEGGKIASCKVTVKEKPVAVTGVKMVISSSTIFSCNSQQLYCVIAPSNATNKTVKWSSSDESVATVSSSGNVTGVSSGYATITVTTEDGGFTAESKIIGTVPISVTGITLNKSSVTLLEGEQDHLVAIVTPANATNKKIEWTSSNTSVATVSDNGTVTAIATGNATITAITEDKGFEATCEVEVREIIIDIPDANFKNYLVNRARFDTNGDGEISLKEAKIPTTIDCSSKGIGSLEGIQYFTALTSLNCSTNSLTSIDLSANTALTNLYCHKNTLTSLDLSNDTALTYLSCYTNKLTALDLSDNTSLTYLSCYKNSLTSLDLSANTALTNLDCNSNKLTSLELPSSTALTWVDCHGNLLTTVDLSSNTALTYFRCYNNQLTSLDVSKNTALTFLDFFTNQLTSLDVSKNTALTTLNCYYNQLTSLDLSSNTALTSLWCYYNQLTSLDLSKNTALTQLYCQYNRLTSLDLSANTALTVLQCGRQTTSGGIPLSLTLLISQQNMWNNMLASYASFNSNVTPHFIP